MRVPGTPSIPYPCIELSYAAALAVACFPGLVCCWALPCRRCGPSAAAAAAGLLVRAISRSGIFRHFSWYRSYRDLSHLPLALVLAAACLGIVRYQAAQIPLTEDDLAWYNGRGEFRLEGVIQQPPLVGDKAVSLLVSVEQLVSLSDGQLRTVRGAWPGHTCPWAQNWRYGDRIQLTGEPEEPEIEGAPFYHDVLARQGIYTTLSFAAARLVNTNQGSWFLSAVYDFRALADRTIARLLPQPAIGPAGGHPARRRQRLA